MDVFFNVLFSFWLNKSDQSVSFKLLLTWNTKQVLNHESTKFLLFYNVYLISRLLIYLKVIPFNIVAR